MQVITAVCKKHLKQNGKEEKELKIKGYSKIQY